MKVAVPSYQVRPWLCICVGGGTSLFEMLDPPLDNEHHYLTNSQTFATKLCIDTRLKKIVKDFEFILKFLLVVDANDGHLIKIICLHYSPADYYN